MKMTSRGKRPEDKTWAGRCHSCKSEYEAKLSELLCDSFDQREPPAYYAACEVCQARVYFKEGRP